MGQQTDPGTGASILEEGKTCWRIARAGRIAVLVDAESYYSAVLDALRQARWRIMVIAWDFDPRVRLDPADAQAELGRVLRACVEAHPDLSVHVLVWDVAPIYGPSRTMGPLLDREWQEHPRIHLHFDSHHPPGASHHEKIVCVDDAVAFVGGIDLTVRRWDSCRHQPNDPRRVSPEGEPYPPLHDLQLAVSGEAARAVAQLARRRWADAGGEPPAPCPITADPWPRLVEPWLSDTRVGIARTRPRMEDGAAIAEIAALNDAALAAARDSVYIETQYLVAERIVERLAALLGRDAPPEIVILVWHDASGWIERFAMGSNRERALRRLAAADHRGRLRAYKLMSPGAGGQEVMLHAKLIVIDDRFVRIGSSNLNNRSLGVDTECDLALEANDAATTRAVAELKVTLLAEHLERSTDEVRRAMAAHGLIGTIERLGAGRLQRYAIDPSRGPLEPLTGTALLDPVEPLDLHYLARRLSSLRLSG